MENWSHEKDFTLHNLLLDRIENLATKIINRDLTEEEQAELSHLKELLLIIGPRIKEEMEDRDKKNRWN